VRGYSRDHRPELNQVVLNLSTENQAGIPIYSKRQVVTLTIMKALKILLSSMLKALKRLTIIATSSLMLHCIRQRRSSRLMSKVNYLYQEHHKS
jgi:hypothetical protein